MPVYIPLLLPLTIIAVPVADLVLAIVRRTWNGQSPFAADRGHLHHRLLEIGHSHSRAVLIMYFWSALIAFGAVAYSVNSAPPVDRAGHRRAQRGRSRAAAAAALHAARAPLGGAVRAAPLPRRAGARRRPAVAAVAAEDGPDEPRIADQRAPVPAGSTGPPPSATARMVPGAHFRQDGRTYPPSADSTMAHTRRHAVRHHLHVRHV